MDPAFLPAATAAWVIVSALAVVTLGVLSFLGARSRPPGTLAFAGFAGLWGLHVVAGQWMAFAPEAAAHRAHLAYLVLLIPLPYLVVEFTAAYTKSYGSTAAWRAIRVVVGSLAGLCALLLVTAPGLLYLGASTMDGEVYPRWGPLFAPLTIAPFFGALTLALVMFDGARRRAPTARTAVRHALIASGLATFTAFSLANNLALYAVDLFVGLYAPQPGYVILFAALSAAVVATAARAWLDAGRTPSRTARKAALTVAAAASLPFLWGAIEGAIAALWLPRLNTVGVWRLVGVALLAYGLARWRSPDLPETTRRNAATAAGVAGATVLGGLSAGAVFLLFPSVPFVLFAALAVPVATLRSSVRAAHRALHVDKARGSPDQDLARRLDTYRAALESALARGTMEEDATFLAGLRGRLGITQDAHDTLLCIARTSVLPPADGSHPGYERLRLLGEGAQGRVWLARRRMDDDLVVLKETNAPHPDSAKALRRQARLATKLRDPHLLEVQDLVETPKGPVLVTEYVPGGSLDDRLREGPLPPDEAIRFTIETLRGLEALHAAGLAHGDIKPANVLVDAEGRAKLADFGLARSFAGDATATQVGAEGTLSVMAPEQLDGAPPTPASDVYAVGALLYRLLTAKHYVDLRGVPDLEARHRIRESVPGYGHPLVPRAVEPVIRRALEKDPRARTSSAAAMREALERAARQD